MVRNDEIHKQALIFRKRGFTYTEIATICGVHKSTVARWCTGKRFNTTVRTQNAARAAKDNAKRVSLLQMTRMRAQERRYSEAAAAAKTTYQHYQLAPLFIAGVMLYAASGDRSDSAKIRFTSNNPASHRIFRRFMAEYMGVDKGELPFWLLLYASHDIDACQKVWSKALSLPTSKFGKTQVIKQRSNTLHKGTGNTIIGNTVMKRTLLAWIEIAEKRL